MLAALDTITYRVRLEHLGEAATVNVTARTPLYARQLARRVAASMGLIPNPGSLHVFTTAQPVMSKHTMPHLRYTIVAQRNPDPDAPADRQWTCRIEDEHGNGVPMERALYARTRAGAWQAGIRYVDEELVEG